MIDMEGSEEKLPNKFRPYAKLAGANQHKFYFINQRNEAYDEIEHFYISKRAKFQS